MIGDSGFMGVKAPEVRKFTVSSVLFSQYYGGGTRILTATRPVLSTEELSDGLDAILPRGAPKESVGV